MKRIGHIIKYELFKNDKRKALGVAYFYLMGIIFHAVPYTRPLVVKITPLFLLLAGGFIFYFVARERNRAVLLWAAATYVFTTIVEIIGVRTGIIFGPYEYGTVLGPKIFGAPLIIGFNWVLVILGLCRFSRGITRFPWLSAGIVGIGAVIFDFLLEPIAIRLEYWTWFGPTVPVRNYIAWFIVAYVSALLYHLKKMETDTKLPLYYVGIQVCFFFVLRFIV